MKYIVKLLALLVIGWVLTSVDVMLFKHEFAFESQLANIAMISFVCLLSGIYLLRSVMFMFEIYIDTMLARCLSFLSIGNGIGMLYGNVGSVGVAVVAILIGIPGAIHMYAQYNSYVAEAVQYLDEWFETFRK